MQDIRILVVEDEDAIRELIKINLTRVGYKVDEAPDVHSAKEILAKNRPNLILLDWMLPDTSGLNLAKELQSSSSTINIPIIMLTARGEEEDRVLGFTAGCEDYLVKPFYPSELIARIQVILRRTIQSDNKEYIKAGKLIINGASKRVSVEGNLIHLGRTEYNLLEFMASRPERVFSRESLLDNVWQDNIHIEDRTIDVHIRRIRKALEPYNCDSYIQTVRGCGYMFSY